MPVIIKNTDKVQYTNDLHINGIYFMHYKAKGAEERTLRVYDKAPIFIALDLAVDRILAVNLHWIPISKRQKFLNTVLDMSKIPTKRGFIYKINLMYSMLKSDSTLWNACRYAIRQYLYTHITSIQKIPPEMYETVLKIPRMRSRFAYRARDYKH
jgi:hypothetical protein